MADHDDVLGQRGGGGQEIGGLVRSQARFGLLHHLPRPHDIGQQDGGVLGAFPAAVDDAGDAHPTPRHEDRQALDVLASFFGQRLFGILFRRRRGAVPNQVKLHRLLSRPADKIYWKWATRMASATVS